MAQEKKIKDSARAIDATDMIKRARKRSLIRLLWSTIGIVILVFIAIWLYNCVNSIFELAGEEEVPAAASE